MPSPSPVARARRDRPPTAPSAPPAGRTVPGRCTTGCGPVTRSGRGRRRRRDALAVIAKEPVAGLAKTRLVPALARPAQPGWRASCWPTPWRRSARPARTHGCASHQPRPGSDSAAWRPGSGCWPRARRPRRPLSRLPGRPAGDGRRSSDDRRRRHPPCPDRQLPAAFALLDEADVVLGPALDGGYYLVAAKAARPEPFVGVPMGTDAVLTETLARAARAGLVVDLLPPLRDLDRVEDLAAALAAGDLDAAPATLAAATELLAVEAAVP
jgi:HAMP domain-containing protein